MSTNYNEYGMVLTVDYMVDNYAYAQSVIPVCHGGGAAINKRREAYNCLAAFNGTPLNRLRACLPQRTSIIGIGCEPMTNGRIPYRENYAVDVNQGTRSGAAPTADPEPSSVGVVVDFFFDPADLPPITPPAVPARTVVAHNTFPGIWEEDTGGNVITDALYDLFNDFALSLYDGTMTFDDTGDGGDLLVWKRVNKILRGAVNQVVREVATHAVKKIVGSVERRLRPPKR
jgi:hypothetical protein